MSSKIRTGIVYCFINKTNGKRYIGKTVNEKERMLRHKRDAKTPDRALYHAVQKYGWDNFEYIVLFSITGDDIREIDKEIQIKEKEFIEKYMSSVYGYNMTTGGDGAAGRRASATTKAKMSEAQRRRGAWPMLAEINKKKVLKYDLTGNFICEYTSLVEAAAGCGGNPKHISRCCRGDRHKTRGYLWRYKVGPIILHIKPPSRKKYSEETIERMRQGQLRRNTNKANL